MRLVVQRVSRASVRVDGAATGAIGRGLVLLVGVGRDDDGAAAERLAAKVAGLRVFEGEGSTFARTLAEVEGAVLVVSQFTLLAEVSKGTRPNLSAAAPPDVAEPLYERFCARLSELGVPVETGVFGARMELELVNDGPVTLLLS
jgi:D-aminoacyl-tRNA deacylase